MRDPADPLRILQVSRGDMGNGAYNVAWGLFRGYRARGHISRLAVRVKRSTDRDVAIIPNEVPAGPWASVWNKAGDAFVSVEGKIPRGVGPLGRMVGKIGVPQHSLSDWQGIDDFDYPGSWRILDMWQDRPNVIQGHSLRGGFFDLRALPWLGSKATVVITLHDGWYLSGHCAHSLDCERWKTGCGRCPDLSLSPPVRRDSTDYNWERKREIYRKSQLYLATPSRWLMQKVEESILMEGAVDLQIIPNGVDLSVWRPGEKAMARSSLGLPPDAKILLFVSAQMRSSAYKDCATVRAAGLRLAEHLPGERVLVLMLGDTAPPERVGNAEFRFVPAEYDPAVVAAYYQAADVYVHAAHAETFPLALIEAMACGKPCVATSVGGIPEIIEDGKGGFLVPHGDAEMMADRVEELIADPAKLSRFEQGALDRARGFDLNRQVDQYLDWFARIAGSP